MPAIRGITIAVGEWYARTLEITLVRNLRHLTEVVVVTSPGDDEVKEVAARFPHVRIFETDAFTRHGARFNKGLAMEEGLDALGREGWILIHDADILFSDRLPLDLIKPGTIYGARRRILEDVSTWTPELSWASLPPVRDGGPVGFFQLFHASDPALVGKSQWYDVSFTHAGGGDAYFMAHWPRGRQVILPTEVLHLGPIDTNWFGTDREGRDIMAKFTHDNGWRRAMMRHSPEAAERAPEVPDRIEVPGYEPTGFELPFARRLAMRRPQTGA